jgi:hypothetical protein
MATVLHRRERRLVRVLDPFADDHTDAEAIATYQWSQLTLDAQNAENSGLSWIG